MRSIYYRLCIALSLTIAPAYKASAQHLLAQVATVPDSNLPAEPITFIWNKAFTYDGILEQCRKLVKAYPDLVQMESIGESASGRRIWALSISNHKLENVHQKPGFLVEGNTLHEANLGSEHALYLAWYLAKNYATDQEITQLLDQKVLYIIPVTFPDTKENKSSTKQYVASLDDDNDGRMEEDGPEDLNNDGVISLMRRRVPNGAYSTDPANPLKIVPATTTGVNYEWLGYEGFDKDRDGQVNEDPIGYQAIDRDWAWKWQPTYSKTGTSSTYPFSIPENRALKDFITKRPNIAAVQLQYRQSDAVLLNLNRTSQELQVPNDSAASGESLWLNHITSSQKWKWLKYARGVHTFPVQIYQNNNGGLPSAADSVNPSVISKPMLTAKGPYLEWMPFEHPFFGPIEIGGLQISPENLPEGDVLEKDLELFAHQTIENAQKLPQLVIQNLEKKVMADGLTEITATIQNNGSLATHTAEDLLHRIERADYITLKDGVILASGLVGEKELQQPQNIPQPNRVELTNIPANATIQLRWIVKPTNPTLLLEIDSRKGGVVSTRF